MQRYLVSTRGEAPTSVLATNWLSALGEGLQQLGLVAELDRLACEVLPNGTVIARDVRTGTGFIVRQAGTEVAPLPGEDMPTEPHLSGDSGPSGSSSGSERKRAVHREWATSDVLSVTEEDSEELQIEIGGYQDDPVGLLKDHLVHTLVRSIAAAPSSVAAWQRALEVGRELLGAESGAALALEPDGLRFVGALGPKGQELVGVLLPENAGVAGFCCRRRVSLVVQDAYRDARFFRELDQETGYTTRQIVCVPVGTAARVHGCLELINPVGGGTFGRMEIEILDRVAEALYKRLVALG